MEFVQKLTSSFTYHLQTVDLVSSFYLKYFSSFLSDKLEIKYAEIFNGPKL